jgi:mRNA interferase RelE/StbE
MAPARRVFDRLPISVAAAVLETLDAVAENPKRLGKRLMPEHEGRFSARRGPYRIIYELDEDDRLVRVVAIGHRRDVYRRRGRNVRRLAGSDRYVEARVSVQMLPVSPEPRAGAVAVASDAARALRVAN